MALIKVHMSVDPSSMGDGWGDQEEAANAFAGLLKERVSQREAEYDLMRIIEASLDGFQNKCWEEFCGSQ